MIEMMINVFLLLCGLGFSAVGAVIWIVADIRGDKTLGLVALVAGIGFLWAGIERSGLIAWLAA
jgi:hypothetical protein